MLIVPPLHNEHHVLVLMSSVMLFDCKKIITFLQVIIIHTS